MSGLSKGLPSFSTLGTGCIGTRWAPYQSQPSHQDQGQSRFSHWQWCQQILYQKSLAHLPCESANQIAPPCGHGWQLFLPQTDWMLEMCHELLGNLWDADAFSSGILVHWEAVPFHVLSDAKVKSKVESKWAEKIYPVFDALKGSYGVKQAMILCHTPSDLVADESSSLGTHDLFDEFLGKDSLSLISVFPNVGIIRQALKGKKDEPFTVDCILACHHSCDPLDVSIDVVGRFGIDFHHISEVVFVTDMPKGMYRPHATSAYRVRVHNKTHTKTRILWKKQQEQFDEFLIPKHIAGKEDVKSIINDLSGPLIRRSYKRNSCFDFEGGKNYDPLSFKPGASGIKPYREELKRLTDVCQRHCEDLPSAAIQFKERINWRWLCQEEGLEKTVLFCRLTQLALTAACLFDQCIMLNCLFLLQLNKVLTALAFGEMVYTQVTEISYQWT